jgi:predicted nucleotide-binding protein
MQGFLPTPAPQPRPCRLVQVFDLRAGDRCCSGFADRPSVFYAPVLLRAGHRYYDGRRFRVLSRNLEQTLHRAISLASERRHQYATLEHCLLALVDDSDAAAVLDACLDLGILRNRLTKFVDEDLAGLAVEKQPGDPKPTAGLERVVQRAASHVQSSGGNEVTGAHVLVALFSERESHAVYFLGEQEMSRLDAVNFISLGISKRPATAKSQHQSMPADRGPQPSPVPTTPQSSSNPGSRRVFIVHGHDEAALHAAARMVERLGMEAVILRDQANSGQTVIEQFEEHGEQASFAVVLLTPDDVGGPCNAAPEQLRHRARQNVVAELFFLIGKLGRGRVCALVKGDVELPSDLAGVVHETMDDQGHWRYALGREMRKAGLPVDLDRI